jgi:4a-hydroxytetrahydrobiopterin dehydratase
MEHTPVTADQLANLDGLEGWRWASEAIHADFRAGSFEAAADLIVAIASAAEAVDHHPDIDLRHPDRVHVVLTTHDAGTVTTRDVELARTISGLAAEAGASAEPSAEDP